MVNYYIYEVINMEYIKNMGNGIFMSWDIEPTCEICGKVCGPDDYYEGHDVCEVCLDAFLHRYD
jgi:hypothetical protein